VLSTLYLYLHTHWDREWYWSFGAYRTQLISVVKNILHLLETGALDNFMLDGQTALLEDVLEVSPSLAQPIKDLVEGGKLFIGPWYVLADQMLVGGESLVRNLRYGLQLSETFGGPTRVGYCPDTFGHSADLPRILKGFAIDSAVVWRGVPPLKLSPVFDWRSPDGSEVLTLDLTQGYYQSAFSEGVSSADLAKYLLAFVGLERSAEGLLSEKELGAKAAPMIVPQLQAALFPVGADHVGPQFDFKKQLQAAFEIINSGGSEIKAQTISLVDFFDILKHAVAAQSAAEPVRLIAGELRDNSSAFEYCRAYMLDGVLSTRLYLKRANRLSEYKILRQVEPFRALLAAHKILPYSGDELDYNWKLLLKNQPHDSICGCSVDSVHREMQARTITLDDGLDLLITQGKEALLQNSEHINTQQVEVRFGARHLDVTDPHLKNERLVVFNAAATPFVGPVRVRLAVEDPDTELPPGLQQVRSHKATETFIGLSRVPVFKDITVIDGYLDCGSIPLATLKSLPLTAPVMDSTICRIDVDEKSFGAVSLINQFFELHFTQEGELCVEVKSPGRSASKSSSSSSSYVKLGHHIVDTGDGGDTYNYDPVAGDKPIRARLVSIAPGKQGPLVASLVAHYQIDLPEGLLEKGELSKNGEAEAAPRLTVFERAKVRVPHKIECEIILKKGVPIVFFETTMQNLVDDHRLEVIFDLPKVTEFTFSENHFSLIKRHHDKKSELHPLIAPDQMENLGHESALSRHPCQRFFVAGESTFMNVGLPEYGVGGRAVSITLLRATSYLSRKRLRTRGGGAGPIMPTPEANCRGAMMASYAWAPTKSAQALLPEHSALPDEAAPFLLADLYESQPISFIAPALSVADKSLSIFAIDDPAIRVTATYISERLVIRLLNSTSKARVVNLDLFIAASAVTITSLECIEIKPLSGHGDGGPRQFSLQFKSWELLTLNCQI